MELPIVVFLAGAAVLVLALGVYLIVVALKLRRVINTLESVASGVERIADQTRPVGELVGRLSDAVGSPRSDSESGRL